MVVFQIDHSIILHIYGCFLLMTALRSREMALVLFLAGVFKETIDPIFNIADIMGNIVGIWVGAWVNKYVAKKIRDI